MLEYLTQEQEDMIPVYRDNWLKIGLATGPCDFDKAKAAAIRCYELAGLEPPKYFFRFESPISAAIGASMIEKLFKYISKENVWDKVMPQVFGQVSELVLEQVGDKSWKRVGPRVSIHVWDKIFNQAREQLRDQVYNPVVDQVLDQIDDQVNSQVKYQVYKQVADQAFDQVDKQVADQVCHQVWEQISNQAFDQVRYCVDDQLMNQVRNQLMDQVWYQVRDQIRNKVWDQVSEQVWDKVWDQVGQQLSSHVDKQVADQVFHQVDEHVADQVCHQVDDEVWRQVYIQVHNNVYYKIFAELKNNKDYKKYFNDQIYGNHEAGWLGYVSYFKEVCGIKSLGKIEGLVEIAKNCGWWAPYKDVVIFQDRPEYIKFDEDKRLHCADGPAIRYTDGFSVYAFNGVRVPESWIKKTAPLEEIFDEENSDKRAVGIEIYGWDKFIDMLKLGLIDKDEDPLIGNLYESSHEDFKGDKFLYAKCGTGRMALVPVDPKYKTARQANAGSYGLAPSIFENGFIRT